MEIIYESIKNINVKDALEHKYDIGVFPCGYEKRATYIASKIKKSKIKCPIVIGFKEFNDDFNRIQNNLVYEKIGWPIIETSSQNISSIKTTLIKLVKDIKDHDNVNVLFDYSSFPKIYYINFLQILREIFPNNMSVTFLYSAAYLDKGDVREVPTSTYEILHKNFEFNKSSIFIIGTCIDVGRTLALIEDTYANKIILIQPYPGVTSIHTQIAKKQLKYFKDYADQIIPVNISNFQNMFSKITDIALSQTKMGKVILIPDGPKPITLALGMVGNRYKGAIGTLLVRRIEPTYLRNSKPIGKVFAFTIDIKSNEME